MINKTLLHNRLKQYCFIAITGIVLNLILLFPSLAITDCIAQIDIPSSECEALLSLFNSTHGTDWSDVSDNSWNATNTPCSWAGIICRDKRVIELNRQAQGLEGAIPNLTDLTSLKILDLSHNKINGSIDSTHLPTSLQRILLNDNKITGEAPDLTELIQLKTLDLGNNLLTGTIQLPHQLIDTGTLKFSQTNYRLNENDGTLTVTVKRIGNTYGEDRTNYATLSGSAKAGRDFEVAKGLLTWTVDNSSDKTFTITIINDAFKEDNETFIIILKNSNGILDKAKITIVDNDTTLSDGSSSTPSCPTDRLSISSTCNASGNTLPCNVTIEEGASVAQAVFECDAENKGWLSNSTIKAGATIQGGILTGGISNDGILADFDFRGSSIIGGTLSGLIVNNSQVGGYFQDVSLAPDTQISGGELKGNIMGDADAPALIEKAEILEGSQLSSVTIGENTQVATDVKIGAGVRFTHHDQIPTGTDLTAALVINFADNRPPTINMNTDVLIEAPTLLEQINGLSEIKDSDWQLVQNTENGQLELISEEIRFAVLPVQLKQTNSHAKLTINPDKSITFITAQGREILAYPVLQELSALIEAVAPLGIHQLALQENGILTAERNEGKVVARTDIAATPVSDDEPLGLFPSELNAMRLIFEDDTGQKRQQRIYPTCAYPKALDDYSFTLSNKGIAAITIKGKRYQGIFDYMVSPNENGEPDTQVVFTPVSENGNIVAFEVNYPTSERQILRLIPFQRNLKNKPPSKTQESRAN